MLKESVNVLLEAAPAGLDMAALERAVREAPGVLGVHDLHIWTVGSGIVECSCHVVVAEQSVREGQQVLRAVAGLLRERFRVTHTTIQVEVEGCEPDDMYCTLRPAEAGREGHNHESGVEETGRKMVWRVGGGRRGRGDAGGWGVGGVGSIHRSNFASKRSRRRSHRPLDRMTAD